MRIRSTALHLLCVQCAIAERDQLTEEVATLRQDIKDKDSVIEDLFKECEEQQRGVSDLLEHVEYQDSHIRGLQAVLDDDFVDVEGDVRSSDASRVLV